MNCGVEQFGNKQRCPACKRPHRLDRSGNVPARECYGERATVPCRFTGESTGTVECLTCCGAVRIKTFACDCGSVPESKASLSPKLPDPDVASCLACDFYEAKPMSETIVAVTTARRDVPTIVATLRSLKAAGFDRVYVFSDGEDARFGATGGSLPEVVNIVRHQRLGAWSNWLLAFQEINLRHPDAARYAIFQDDVLVPRNLASWLETNVDDSAPVWSLFCAGAHSTNSPGWLNVTPGYGGYAYCGAQAFVIPAAWSLKLLSDPGIVSHKRNPPGKGDPKSHWKGTGEQHVDGAIGRFAVAAGGYVRTHYPSIASHVGETSAIVPGKRLDTANRKERAFVGETYDLTNPLVACIMLSGGHPDRQHFALDAIRDFHAQTYERRILVIVDSHEAPLTDSFDVTCDSRIVYIRTQPTALGSLRNLGLLAARKAGAGLFMPWDDDDRRSPDRIAAQVAATPLGFASVLRSHTVRAEGREDVVRSWEGVNQRLPGYPGLLLAPLYYPLSYKPEQRHEDTKFVAELWKWTRVIGLDLDPLLYVRRIHDHNVSPPEHFERLLKTQEVA